MEKILVINCGSSSLKYEVYEMPEKNSIGRGVAERIGGSGSFLTQNSDKGELHIEKPMQDHKDAMEVLISALADPEKGILNKISEITGVGHRVVHGGEEYASSVVIDDGVVKAIHENIELAPLHNPANLTGIELSLRLLPNVKQVAVFDTAYHQTLPPAAYLYGLPREFYDKHKIRRYGFHGTSHRYVAAEALKLMKRSPENTNVISCHLGNGASITAIENGRSVDTSMGFTPLEGLVMGTRCGDLDPAILLYLIERGFSPAELNDVLNKQGGMLGLSGVSNDMRDISKAAAEGNKNAQEALDVYAYRIRKYIGSYAANLVKVDILVFTGGIGQHQITMRDRVCSKLANIGIVLDEEKNVENGSKMGVISKEYSPTAIVVIPTNEELQIAIDTYDIVFKETT